jgi:hypothetical protein
LCARSIDSVIFFLYPNSRIINHKGGIMFRRFSRKVELISRGSSVPNITLDADTGELIIGGIGKEGTIKVKNEDGTMIAKIGENIGKYRAYNKEGEEVFCVLEPGHLHLGGGEHGGYMNIKSSDRRGRIRMDGNQSNLWLGGNDRSGNLIMFHQGGDNESLDQATVNLDGDQANLWLGGNGRDGDLLIFSSSGNNQTDSQATIHMNGETGELFISGDIHLVGADCAENFTVQDRSGIIPGTVLVIREEGSLAPSQQPYDSKVAGVVSGAGGLRPGIILDDTLDQSGACPVALSGKTYCRVTNQGGPVSVGDLLTTSALEGCAMKASDPQKSFGAVIGKALQPLDVEEGLIPILVALH